MCAGSWDLKKQGHVYALSIGPYGVLLALCWDREAAGSPSRLVLLTEDAGKVAFVGHNML